MDARINDGMLIKTPSVVTSRLTEVPPNGVIGIDKVAAEPDPNLTVEYKEPSGNENSSLAKNANLQAKLHAPRLLNTTVTHIPIPDSDEVPNPNGSLLGLRSTLIAPANLLGITVANRYKIESHLGDGGMAHVYKVINTETNKYFALKVMKVLSTSAVDTNLLKRFIREGTTMQKLEHPHIIPVYEIGNDNGIQFIVMELMEGGTLRTNSDKLSPDQQLLIIADICEALDYVHNKRVVHRDLKPENILLTLEKTNGKYPPHPMAKLADFGLYLDNNESRISRSGDLAGTGSYMSTEQASGEKNLTGLSDLYTVGVILYELATGKVPFEGTFLSVVNQHKTSKPVKPSTHNPAISKRLETLILSLMEKEPSRRGFKAAKEVAQELRDIASPLKAKIKIRPFV